MGRIFLSSDLHFNHDKEFIFKPRGFNTVWEMNEVIIQRWNEVVNIEDEVYVLGDLMLGDNDKGLDCIKRLKGQIHIVLGNHDNDVRQFLYENSCYNIVEVENAIRLKYNKYHFFMTHYPCITSNLEKESLHQCTINCFGHTHQTTNFYNEMPFMYHVGVDSHQCRPVLLDEVIADCEAKVKECKNLL